MFRFAAIEALRDDGEVFAVRRLGARPGAPGLHARASRSRLVAAITPFNHPLNQVAHKVAPAIAAGAPIVLKPSERTPLAALWLARRRSPSAGCPADAVADRHRRARPMIVDAFLEHPAVDVVSFTGGVAVGKQIAARLGYRRAVLELGGNDPLIVLADADLDLAGRAGGRRRVRATAGSGARRSSGSSPIDAVASELAPSVVVERACRARRRRSARRAHRRRDA